MKSGWAKRSIDDICTFRGGGTPSKKTPSYWKGDIPWVSPKDMKSDVILDSIDHITTEAIAHSTTNLIPANSILVVVRSGILARTIPVAITGRNVTINQDIKALCPNDSVDPWFLFYYLKSRLSEMLALASRGATVHRIMADQIRDMDIPVPPVSEQRRIVGILDEAFAGIATAKANAEKNLQNARALFESHLNAVFARRGDGWGEKLLGETCENLDSKRVPITKSKRVVGEYPYYGASGIVDYVNDYIFDEDLLLVSEDGANLLARTYPIAFSVSGKVWVNNHAHVLRFSDCASQRLMEFYLNSIKLDPYVSGMAQPKLNQKSLNSIPVPSPPLPQRQTIVANLDSLQQETQRLETIYQRKLAALDELKKSLLHQAFSGQLTGDSVCQAVSE
jgi:type I restriction enzyme S subunit